MNPRKRSCSSPLRLSPQPPPPASDAVAVLHSQTPAATSGGRSMKAAFGQLDAATISSIVDSLGWESLYRLRHATHALNTLALQREERVLGSGRILYLNDAAEYLCYNREEAQFDPVITLEGIARLRAQFDHELRRASSKPIVIVVDNFYDEYTGAPTAILDFSRHIRECGHPNITTIACGKRIRRSALHILAAGKHRYAPRYCDAEMFSMFYHQIDEEFERQIDYLLASSTTPGDCIPRKNLHYLLLKEWEYDRRLVPTAQLKKWGLLDEFIDEKLLQLIDRGRTIGPMRCRFENDSRNE